jgi:LysM repeat protein
MHKIFVNMAAGLGVAVVLSGSALASDGGAAKTADKPAPTPPPPKVHVVQSGDSLSSVAESEQLDSWRPLWNANTEVTDPNLIYEGQKLTVPQGPTEDRPLPEAAPVSYAPRYQAPARTSAATGAARHASAANYAAGAPGLLERVRMREAGGNYATNTGNGYYGAYQFSLGTWQSVGGTGLPSNASPAEQDMRAQMLYDRRGCSPWPNTCY